MNSLELGDMPLSDMPDEEMLDRAICAEHLLSRFDYELEDEKDVYTMDLDKLEMDILLELLENNR